MSRVSLFKDKKGYEHENEITEDEEQTLSKKLRDDELDNEDDYTNNDDEDNEDNENNENNEDVSEIDNVGKSSSFSSSSELISYNGFVLGEKSKNSLFSIVDEASLEEEEEDQDGKEQEDLECADDETRSKELSSTVYDDIAQVLHQDKDIFCLMCLASSMLEKQMERVIYAQKYEALITQYTMGEISTIKLYNSLVILKQNIDREKDIEENSVVDVMKKCKIEDMYIHIVKDHERRGARNLKIFTMLAISDLYSSYRRIEEPDLRSYEILAKIFEKFQNVLAREGK